MKIAASEFLTAEWRYLAMLNYEIDPALLLQRAPNGTELDSWEGKTFVSMVGFLFLNTRVLGYAIPFYRDFEEVNFRFYVRRKGPEGWRRGVVFMKEIVPKRAIAAVARIVYNENYIALPMRHEIVPPTTNFFENNGKIEYAWRFNDQWNCLWVKPSGESKALVVGSQEEFITEHYWGYAAQRDGGCVEYQVEHPSWRVWQVTGSSLQCDIAALYGEEFVSSLKGRPSSAFLAEGSPVIVKKGTRL
jgi:uncharacterized protein YqjF (DUF2071 family)